MKKHQLLEKISLAWEEFQQSYAGLDDAELTEPGVTEGWSVKDILGHVSTWEQEAIKYLPMILASQRPPRYKDAYGGIDAFNARMTEEKSTLPLQEILKQLERTHRELVRAVESAPEEQFTRETPFRRRLRLDTYSHYPIHAAAIRAWRERAA